MNIDKIAILIKKAAPEFFAVGIASTAFLTGSVKGGG